MTYWIAEATGWGGAETTNQVCSARRHTLATDRSVQHSGQPSAPNQTPVIYSATPQPGGPAAPPWGMAYGPPVGTSHTTGWPYQASHQPPMRQPFLGAPTYYGQGLVPSPPRLHYGSTPGIHNPPTPAPMQQPVYGPLSHPSAANSASLGQRPRFSTNFCDPRPSSVMSGVTSTNATSAGETLFTHAGSQALSEHSTTDLRGMTAVSSQPNASGSAPISSHGQASPLPVANPLFLSKEQRARELGESRETQPFHDSELQMLFEHLVGRGASPSRVMVAISALRAPRDEGQLVHLNQEWVLVSFLFSSIHILIIASIACQK